MVKDLEDICIKEELKVVGSDVLKGTKAVVTAPLYAVAGTVLPGFVQKKLSEKTSYNPKAATWLSMIGTTVGGPALLETLNPAYSSIWGLVGIGAGIGVTELVSRGIIMAGSIEQEGRPVRYFPAALPVEIAAAPFRLAGKGVMKYWNGVKKRARENTRRR